jgi:hypothetical protein
VKRREHHTGRNEDKNFTLPPTGDLVCVLKDDPDDQDKKDHPDAVLDVLGNEIRPELELSLEGTRKEDLVDAPVSPHKQGFTWLSIL